MEIEHVHIERGALERGSRKEQEGGRRLNASPECVLSTGEESPSGSPLTDTA